MLSLLETIVIGGVAFLISISEGEILYSDYFVNEHVHEAATFFPPSWKPFTVSEVPMEEKKGEIPSTIVSPQIATSVSSPIVSEEVLTSIVTQYFYYNSHAFSATEYLSYLSKMVISLHNPIIIFTDVASVKLIKSQVKSTSHVFFITDYDFLKGNPDLPAVSDTFLLEQHDKDPNKDDHTKEEYAMSYSKTFAMKVASDKNPFKSKFFFWLDAISFKDIPSGHYHWPDPKDVQDAFQQREGEQCAFSYFIPMDVSDFRVGLSPPPLKEVIQGNTHFWLHNIITPLTYVSQALSLAVL